MSADNFWIIRRDGKVEERRMSTHDEEGVIIHEATSQEAAGEWAEAREEEMNTNGQVIEYGIEWE